jgi:prepilin-type N-terminal cleavage/methylation domain-containing protein
MQNETPAHRVACPRWARGFTLTELLIVIGIIVLVSLLAIPAFRAMTGSRSVESAQNQISAVLARARTEALGLQERRGILFYRDLETQQVGMRMVYATNMAEPFQLDLVPDRDPVLMPAGVGIQFVDNYLGGPASNQRTNDGYIGFNKRVVPGGMADETVVPHGGVILFDGRGQLVSAIYRFRIRYPDPDGAGPLGPRASELGKFLYNDPALTPGGMPLLVLPDVVPGWNETKIGFVLFDAEDFESVQGQNRTGGNTDLDTDVSGTANAAFATEERDEEAWLDENATPVLVNRYNGTLLRAE